MAQRSTSPVQNFDPGRLRDARTASGLSAERLASAAGIQRPNLVAIETGRRVPSVDTLVAVARSLGVAPLELTTATAGRYTLADLRLALGLTRSSVAAAVGVAYETWYAIETGLRGLTDDVAQRSAVALGVDVDDVRAAHRGEGSRVAAAGATAAGVTRRR